MKTARRITHASLAALTLAAIGCAHAPGPAIGTGAASGDLVAAAPRPEQVEYVAVTGSHVRRAVRPGQPLPTGVSPVRVYTREELNTANGANLGAALGVLDPAFRY